MADLAKIKRNVAKMASLGAPEADIDGYIASEGVTIEDVRNYGKPQLSPMTDEQRTQAAKMAEDIRPKKESVALGALSGFGEGSKLFGENVINGLTAGLYGLANRKLGGDFRQRNANAGANKVVNIAGDILGSIGGAGTAAYNLAGRAGLKGITRLAGAGALEGGIRGGTEGDTLGEATKDAFIGSTVGGVSGGALGAVGKAVKRLVPSLNVIGKKSGLENALDDIETLRAINRGSRASDEVAQGVLNRAQGVKGSLNDEMTQALEKARGRELNIQNAIDTQQERLGKYVKQNENMELFTKDPLKAQIEAEPFVENLKKNLTKTAKRDYSLYQGAGSSGNGLGYSELNQKSVNALNAEADGLASAKDIAKELSKDPRFKGVKESNIASVLKPSEWHHTGKDFAKTNYYDVENLLDSEFGKKNLDWLLKDIQQTNADRSFVKRLKDVGVDLGSSKKASIAYKSATGFDIPPMSKAEDKLKYAIDYFKKQYPNFVENIDFQNSPLLSNYTQGLTDFQVGSLNKALAEGASKSTTPLGTLGATHRGQEVLNDMIEASFDKTMIGTKRPTTDTRQLMALKERFNQILEPSGVKPYDVSYSKAQALRTNFEKGYNFKPSETKFESLGLEKARDKRAFLQGRLSKILDNVTDEQSISTLVKKDQNTLKKLMTPKKFSDLIKTANEIESAGRNLKNLETTANSALRRSSDAGRPLSELGESKGSIVGSALDRLFGGIYRRADANTAMHILSGQQIPQYSNTLNSFRYSAPSISALLSQKLIEE